jgi:hypothetical protein
MHALKQEAFVVRRAVPADVPALDHAIAKIDEETEFLAVPGEYMRRWAPGFAERLAAMNAKGTGAYVIAEAGGEIVGFLGAFAGGLKRTRGVVYIAHVGVRRAWRGQGASARRCLRRLRTGRAGRARGGSTCASTPGTRAGLRSMRSVASWSKDASSTGRCATAPGATIF